MTNMKRRLVRELRGLLDAPARDDLEALVVWAEKEAKADIAAAEAEDPCWLCRNRTIGGRPWCTRLEAPRPEVCPVDLRAKRGEHV